MTNTSSALAPFVPLNPAYGAIHKFLRDQGLDEGSAQLAAPPNPELGDYAVGCFPFAKATRRAPNVVADELAQAFAASSGAYAPLNGCTATGPYLNFRVDRSSFIAHVLSKMALEGKAFADDTTGAGKTVVIDYSSPNIAKHLAYHHIRSTMIGHSLRRIWQARGWTVIGINHLGDWGTTFGKLFAAIRRWGGDLDLSSDGVTKLNDLYVRFGREGKEHPELADELEREGRAWFMRLEEGDREARAMWEQVRAVSLAEYESVYRELGVSFDRVMGESEFESAMPGVIESLGHKGLTSISEGALVVDLEADNMPPMLLRKGDGATLYATRDLAALEWRWANLHFDRCLYVVDKGQSLHFKQLFRVAEKAGYEFAGRMEHVSFGLVRLGGKKTGTRTGSVVKLRDVLEEATRAVRERITERNPELADADTVARQVGIGAVVFADLKTAREKDVDFSWDDILAFDGDTGPYVQYTHARCASILRKGGHVTEEVVLGAAKDEAKRAALVGMAATRLELDEEWALVKKLAELPDAIERAQKTNEPMAISSYVLELAATFSRYYDLGNRDPLRRVTVNAPGSEELSTSRQWLTHCVRVGLERGLELLGVVAPVEM